MLFATSCLRLWMAWFGGVLYFTARTATFAFALSRCVLSFASAHRIDISFRIASGISVVAG